MGTCNWAIGRDSAFPTQPLALWDVRHTITVLMNSQITSVTKYDRVAVFRVPVLADGAATILGRNYIDIGLLSPQILSPGHQIRSYTTLTG